MHARNALVIAALLIWIAAAPAAGQEAPTVPPSPTPAATHPKTVTLNLNDLIEFKQERGHAEFDRGIRMELYRDPMVRLAIGLAREQAAGTRGGLVGAQGGPWSATSLLVTIPGAEPRLVLAGPFASDWHDLTPQERVGRVSEQGVFLGLIIGILSGLR